MVCKSLSGGLLQCIHLLQLLLFQRWRQYNGFQHGLLNLKEWSRQKKQNVYCIYIYHEWNQSARCVRELKLVYLVLLYVLFLVTLSLLVNYFSLISSVQIGYFHVWKPVQMQQNMKNVQEFIVDKHSKTKSGLTPLKIFSYESTE